jgi:hypothetical protein
MCFATLEEPLHQQVHLVQKAAKLIKFFFLVKDFSKAKYGDKSEGKEVIHDLIMVLYQVFRHSSNQA